MATTGATFVRRLSPETVVRYLPAVIRITAGLLWLTNLEWKRPPGFGASGGGGLFGFTMLGVEHPILPPFSWILENVVLPNFTLFGWLTLVVETSLAALLLSGTFIRVAALVGAAQAAVIGLTVGWAPDEWGWAYVLMVAVHLAILAMPGAAALSVDGLRAQRRTETFPRAVRAGRPAMAAATAGYGLAVLLLQLDKQLLGSEATTSGVAGIQGTATLGAVLIVVAALLFVSADRPAARPVALVLLALGGTALALYGSAANVLSAGPTTAAVLAAGAAFLLASAPSRT